MAAELGDAWAQNKVETFYWHGIGTKPDREAGITLIGPVVAPAGTVATIEVVVAEATVALTPLNRTVFWLAISLKPLP